MASFSRIVRFKNSAGEIFYGEVPGSDLVTEDTLLGNELDVYNHTTPFEDDFRLANQKETVAQVLSPLSNVPVFECVGVNYLKHVQETGANPPEFPVIFKKPADALAGPFEDISIHPECTQMDYENYVWSSAKTAKNATIDNALSYVLGYTAGNDVSSRYWQWKERSGGQHGSAKGFDKFAPIRPVIVSPKAVGGPHNLALKTIVNGKDIRQSSRTDDLIFKIPEIIRHLSRGTTLRRGTVIMTGTPSGVAAFMKAPGWLEDGDIVEVEIEKIGRLRNKMVFEK